MKINVWSDYACPFCWIGEVRLRKAIKALGLEGEASLIPRAFEINPQAPEIAEVNGLTTVARRYGMTPEQAKAEFDKIAELGRAEGLELNQVDTHHTSTFNAHRLMKLALASGDDGLAHRVNEALFAAFFVKNLNLADSEVLLETGKKAGLAQEVILEVLGSARYAAEVLADEAEAAGLGIHGVPYFAFENGASASGAIPVAELEAMLKKAPGKAGACVCQCASGGCRIK